MRFRAALAFAAIAIVSLVSAAATKRGKKCACHGTSGFRSVSGPDATDLYELVCSHPSPEELAAFFDGRKMDYEHQSSLAIMRTLKEVIFFSDHEALRTIMPRIRFPGACLQHVTRKLMKQALKVNNFEALAFLMTQVACLEEYDGSSVVLPYWKQGSERKLAEARWEAARVQELIALVEAHPGFTASFAASCDDMYFCGNIDKALAMVEYNSHFASHPALKNAQPTALLHPTALLRVLLGNRLMCDASLAQVAQRLCDLGAELTQQQVEAFKQDRPALVKTGQCLEAWVSVETKVPEEEANKVTHPLNHA